MGIQSNMIQLFAPRSSCWVTPTSMTIAMTRSTAVMNVVYNNCSRTSAWGIRYVPLLVAHLVLEHASQELCTGNVADDSFHDRGRWWRTRPRSLGLTTG